MVITKNTTQKELERIFPGEEIKITKDIALNKKFLLYLVENFPKSKITILSGYSTLQTNASPDCLYDNKETKVLADNVSLARANGKDITFDEDFSVEQAITASRKINNIVEEIDSARLNGKPLSNLEKFLWAYQFVADRVYHSENEGDDPSLSRNLISVLNSDKIVCVGFANMLDTILNRLGIPCTTEAMIAWDPSEKAYGGHATCCVRIDDDKYGIHAIFHSDPTLDAKPMKIFTYGAYSFNTALIPYADIDTTYSKPVSLDAVMHSMGKKILSLDDPDLMFSLAPKTLSRLFPEKTGGLSQDKLLRAKAQEYLEQSSIDEVTEDIIESISAKDAKQHYDYHIENVVFSVERLILQHKRGMIQQSINSIYSKLISLGYSKTAIDSLVKKYLTEDKIREGLREYESKMRTGVKLTPALLEKVDNETKNVMNLIDIYSILFETKTPSQIKPYDNQNELLKLSENIAKESVRLTFAGKMVPQDLFVVGHLLRSGIPLEVIKNSIREDISNSDRAGYFYEIQNSRMSEYANTNEQEIYTGLYDRKDIYNDPYEEDFDKLCSKAKYLTYNEFFEAFLNIYLSQGMDKETACKIAKLTLQKTQFAEKPTFGN